MVFLKPLSTNDGLDVFEMLQGIGTKENSFTNPVHDMTYNQFKDWLIQQDHWKKKIDLPEGLVEQSIFWLYDDDIPVGFGKIRHRLTDSSRINGGNIGYAINNRFRGKGYGKLILNLLLLEAKKMKIGEILLTVDNGNEASKRIIEENGGVLIDKNEQRMYYRIYY